jgi:hypothetical protein
MRSSRFTLGWVGGLAFVAIVIVMAEVKATAQQEKVLYNFGATSTDAQGPSAPLFSIPMATFMEQQTLVARRELVRCLS